MVGRYDILSLSGAFSNGAMEIFTHLAKEKFPDPPTPDNPPGTYSYLIARHNGFSDWWMRVCQRNVLNCVAKSIMSGIRSCKATAPTVLPTDHAAEILQMEPTWNYSQTVRVDTPNQSDLQHPREYFRVIYNIRAISQHHEHPCKTCLIIQWMQ